MNLQERIWKYTLYETVCYWRAVIHFLYLNRTFKKSITQIVCVLLAIYFTSVFKIRGKTNSHCLNRAHSFCYIRIWHDICNIFDILDLSITNLKHATFQTSITCQTSMLERNTAIHLGLVIALGCPSNKNIWPGFNNSRVNILFEFYWFKKKSKN